MIAKTDYYSSHNVNVLNLTAKYIISGLFDMHAHVAGVLKNSYNQAKSEDMLKKLLAYGVTTIRNPGGPTDQSVAMKDNVTKGKIKGPQIFTELELLVEAGISPLDVIKIATKNGADALGIKQSGNY
jgi:imidazolonepropionase-like amidohydrolase